MQVMQLPEKWNERRAGAQRRSVLKSALIHCDNATPMKCAVRNISDSGAQLIVSDPAKLTDTFDLQIGDGPPSPCLLAWRDASLVGVMFAGQVRAAASAPAERRTAKRKLTLQGGTITFRGGHCTMPCRIVDLSDGGARLRPLEPLSCPPVFNLIINNGPTHICHVTRRHGDEISVRFDDGQALDRE